jgi:dUTP pyrophosphatase
MKIKYTLNEGAKDPVKATEGSAGWDLFAESARFNEGVWCFNTGVSVEIPEGYVGLLFQRSSVYKTSMWLRNAVGVIDSDYRGTIQFKFKRDASASHKGIYQVGDRIGQLVIVPAPEVALTKVAMLSTSERGDGGFGSTGGCDGN